MNYELAKQLRDAGFPRYEPTLSELIEACGKKFIALYHEDKQFIVLDEQVGIYDSERHANINESRFRGSTPEEAVALLWLELNKK